MVEDLTPLMPGHILCQQRTRRDQNSQNPAHVT